MQRRLRRAFALSVCGLLLAVPVARAFDPATELQNFSKITERERYVTLTPDFLSLLIAQSAQAPLQFAQQLAADPERLPLNVCTINGFECAGDVRFYNWEANGHGIVKPVLFTSRDGATLSGHVWATRAGPPKRPLIVITTGSVQAPEELYWGQAATLAKHGYVVLTYDVQGQGASDVLGEGVDQLEGVPSQQGQPFYDGTEDALNFALSTPSHPYEPAPSCSTGTSHAPKQDRRVAAGFDAAYNPLSALVDPTRVGIAGHSLGAAAVSFVGQKDPRVKATVAWDNLSSPNQGASGTAGTFAIPSCASNPASRTTPPITKPAMGISNDYGITPQPFTSDPNPQDKNSAFLAYRAAGVDSAEMVIRGGCHEESAFIPGVVTGLYPLSCGTLRGNDLLAWYSTAWFDKYVKGDANLGDRELLTDRWRSDAPEAAVDPQHDGNMFSFYYRSRYDFSLAGGGRAVCSDVRAGCPSMGPDGLPPNFSTVGEGLTPDAGAGPSATASTAGAIATSAAKRCARKHSRARNRCLKHAVKRVRHRLSG